MPKIDLVMCICPEMPDFAKNALKIIYHDLVTYSTYQGSNSISQYRAKFTPDSKMYKFLSGVLQSKDKYCYALEDDGKVCYDINTGKRLW